MSIAENRRARYDYAIKETIETGIVLTGSEVRALRSGRANIAESYVSADADGLWLINATIEVMAGTSVGLMAPPHEPRRRRRLLAHRREIDRLAAAVDRDGMTALALEFYWNERGICKVRVALAKGRQARDKREAIKEREWGRQKARILTGN